MSDAIKNLRILVETTFDDFPEVSITRWVEQAIKDYDKAADTIEQQQREIEKLSAYQADLVRELQACQNVLHMLAHHGEVTWAYSEDANKVLDKSPQTSLAEVRARQAYSSFLKAAISYNDYYSASILEEDAQKHANNIRNGKDGE